MKPGQRVRPNDHLPLPSRAAWSAVDAPQGTGLAGGLPFLNREGAALFCWVLSGECGYSQCCLMAIRGYGTHVLLVQRYLYVLDLIVGYSLLDHIVRVLGYFIPHFILRAGHASVSLFLKGALVLLSLLNVADM